MSFKNPSGYSFDGVVAIFPKVLASFGIERPRWRISQLRRFVRRPAVAPRPGRGIVLVHGHVADVMELVFDAQWCDEFKQPFGPAWCGQDW